MHNIKSILNKIQIVTLQLIIGEGGLLMMDMFFAQRVILGKT